MIYLTGVVGICLIAVGRWGSGRVSTLVSASLPEDMRGKQEGAMRRGVWVVQIVGSALLAFSLFGVVYLLSH